MLTKSPDSRENALKWKSLQVSTVLKRGQRQRTFLERDTDANTFQKRIGKLQRQKLLKEEQITSRDEDFNQTYETCKSGVKNQLVNFFRVLSMSERSMTPWTASSWQESIRGRHGSDAVDGTLSLEEKHNMGDNLPLCQNCE